MKSDKYYGPAATRYEEARKHKTTWARENELIASMVRTGPVLDVPIGTGRYIPHYRQNSIPYTGLDTSTDMIAQAKKKDPDGDFKVGSILAMPFIDRQFAHVVCTRLLNWLYPEDMATAVGECARVGRRMTFSIRLGEPGHRSNRGTYTHDEDALLDALAGTILVRREQISQSHAGSYEMWQCRHVGWPDVEAQFKDRRDSPLGTIRRLAGDWAPRMGVEVPDLGPHCRVRCEYWTDGKIAEVLHRAAEVDPAMITPKKPRRTDRPMVAFQVGDRYGLIDGRRRANVWQYQPGRYPVLVIPC